MEKDTKMGSIKDRNGRDLTEVEDIESILNVVTELCPGRLRSIAEGNPSQIGGSQENMWLDGKQK